MCNTSNFITSNTTEIPIDDNHTNTNTDDEDDNFQSFDESRNQSKLLNETSNDIYYSMLPPDNEINLNSSIRQQSSINNEENESINDTTKSNNTDDPDNEVDKDEVEFKNLNNKKEKLIDKIKHSTSNQTQFELFVYKIKFTMFSLTILQENPENFQNKMLGDYMKNEAELYFEHVSSINTSGVLNNKDFLDIRKQFFEACACNDHLLLLCKPINVQFTQKLDKSYLTITDLTCSIGYMELIEYLSNTTIKLASKVAQTSTSKNFKANIMKLATINEIIKFDSTSTPSTPHEACLKLKFLSYEPTVNLLNINTLDKRRVYPKYPLKSTTINLNRLVLDIDISIIDRLYYLLNPLTNDKDGNYSAEATATAYIDDDDEFYALNKAKLNTIHNFLNAFDVKIPNLKVFLRFPIAKIITTTTPTTTTTATVDWRTRSIREQYLILQFSDFCLQLNYYLNDYNKLLQVSCNQINGFYSSLKLADKPIQFAQVNCDENLPIKLIIKLNDIKNVNFLKNIEKLMAETGIIDEFDFKVDSLIGQCNINDQQQQQHQQNNFSPFSSANSHISGKDNHRIINPANKYEMNRFIKHTKLNSEILINLKLPKINLLICNFDFLNDLYNCFLNDLLMWEPLAPKVLSNLIHINTPFEKKYDRFELCKSAILKNDDEDDDEQYSTFTTTNTTTTIPQPPSKLNIVSNVSSLTFGLLSPTISPETSIFKSSSSFILVTADDVDVEYIKFSI